MKRLYALLTASFVCAAVLAQHPHSRGGSPFYWALVGAIAYGSFYIIYLLCGYLIKLIKKNKLIDHTSNETPANGTTFHDSDVLDNTDKVEIPNNLQEESPNKLEMKQVYCRYCGKQIDEDALFCPRCGKKQNVQHVRPNFCLLKNPIICIWRHIIDYLRKKANSLKQNSSKTLFLSYYKKWVKRCVILAAILFCIGLTVMLMIWAFGVYKTYEWTKNDEYREAIAMQDINKADRIARELFQEFADNVHRYDFFDFPTCNYNHIEKGIAILRNAAEKGNPRAQFTLGCIYDGARYDSNYLDWDESFTMQNNKIDHERAAYWYNLAATQGNPSAMGNLANSYRYGQGVEKNLIKATELMKSAAEKGNAYAQLHFGDMYRDGEVWIKVESDSVGGGYLIIHAKPNIEKAKEWWKKALENGDSLAKERLEKIYD